MWICVIILFLLNIFFHICKVQSLTGLILEAYLAPSVSVGSKLT